MSITIVIIIVIILISHIITTIIIIIIIIIITSVPTALCSSHHYRHRHQHHAGLPGRHQLPGSGRLRTEGTDGLTTVTRQSIDVTSHVLTSLP
jgi:hypothetical protein